MKSRCTENEVEEGSIIGLDYEKEDFLYRNAEDLWSNYGVLRVCPYPCFNEIRVPWGGRDDGNGYEEEDLVESDSGCNRMVAECQGDSRRDRVFEVDQSIVKPHIGAHLHNLVQIIMVLVLLQALVSLHFEPAKRG